MYNNRKVVIDNYSESFQRYHLKVKPNENKQCISITYFIILHTDSICNNLYFNSQRVQAKNNPAEQWKNVFCLIQFPYCTGVPSTYSLKNKSNKDRQIKAKDPCCKQGSYPVAICNYNVSSLSLNIRDQSVIYNGDTVFNLSV